MNYNRTKEGIEVEFEDKSKLVTQNVESYLLYEIFVSLQQMLNIMTHSQSFMASTGDTKQ